MFHKPNSCTQGSKKDFPLRKSDRRKLRDRVIETLFTGSATSDSPTASWIDRAEKLIDDAFIGGGEILCRKLKLESGNVTLFLRTASEQSHAATTEPSSGDEQRILMNSFPITWPYTTSTQPILLEMEDIDRKLHLVPLLPLLAALPPPPVTQSTNSTDSSTNDTNDWPNTQIRSTNNTDERRYRIPSITIHPSTSKYLIRGAHLMKCGILLQYNPTFSPPWTLRQSKGLVSIRILDNPQILAVGFVERTLFREYCYSKKTNAKRDGISMGSGDWKDSLNGLVGVDTKGVGVEIVSCYGDDLWKIGLGSSNSNAKISDGVLLGVTNPLGGGRYDDGNFGNVGFCDGRIAVPILEVGQDDVSSSDYEGVETLQEPEEQSIEAVDGMEGLKISNQTETTEKLTSYANETSDATDENEIDHNAILEAAFYSSLLQLLTSKTPLPVPVSTYSAKYLMSAVPQSGPRLDMKQTTYKKIGPFLLEKESSGVIKIAPSKDKKDKCAFLIGIEKSHPDLLAFKRQWKREMEESGQDPTLAMADSKKKKLAVVDLFLIPRRISDGMQLPEDEVKAMNAKTEERRGTGYLTKTECRAILDNYIQKEGLTDPQSKNKMILINGPLCDALYRPSKKNKAADPDNTYYPTSVSCKDLIDQWMSKMDAGHALVEMPGSKILHLSRGEPKPVDIEVEFRQGNKKKFLTRIRGMEEYGVNAELLCNDVSTRFACSGSVEASPVGRAALKKGRVELVFQGHLSEELTALLTGDEKLSTHGGVKGSEFSLPKSVIKVNLRKGVPASKKR
ncbi:hypothetical protein ACHAWO_010104 [Cyclotella atomus]|uniref:SUI1 domain-containing protein n=1 Tax=Cyclotella atomus TaxID=382360 RepID=A0ABD3NXJ5_9STRA